MRQKIHPQSKHNRPGGFTLFEILITLGIIAIIAALSAPAITSMAPNVRLKAAGRDLYATLQDAKMLAIKENRTVTVRFDTAGLVYQDDNASGTYDAGEPMLVLGEDLNNNGTLDALEDHNGNGILDENSGVKYGTGTAPGGFAGNAITQATDISFDSRGIPTVLPAVPPDVGVYLSNENNTNCYAVEVSTAGSIKLHRWNGAAWD